MISFIIAYKIISLFTLNNISILMIEINNQLICDKKANINMNTIF